MAEYEFSNDESISMCVYKITHKISGKSYIGQTVRRVVRRWRDYFKPKSSNSHIGRAIKKYGKNSFIFEVIDTAEDRVGLDHKEIFWMNYYNTLTPNGYNLVSGGTKGRIYSDKSRLKMSNSRKKNPSSPRKGTINSAETRLKISIGNTGKPSPRRKVVTRNDGKTYQSISEAAKESFCSTANIIRQIREPYRTVKGFQFKEGVHLAWYVPKQLKDTLVVRNDGVVFSSVHEAANHIGASVSSIQGVLSGKRSSCFGFTFRRI